MLKAGNKRSAGAAAVLAGKPVPGGSPKRPTPGNPSPIRPARPVGAKQNEEVVVVEGAAAGGVKPPKLFPKDIRVKLERSAKSLRLSDNIAQKMTESLGELHKMYTTAKGDTYEDEMVKFQISHVLLSLTDGIDISAATLDQIMENVKRGINDDTKSGTMEAWMTLVTGSTALTKSILNHEAKGNIVSVAKHWSVVQGALLLFRDTITGYPNPTDRFLEDDVYPAVYEWAKKTLSSGLMEARFQHLAYENAAYVARHVIADQTVLYLTQETEAETGEMVLVEKIGTVSSHEGGMNVRIKNRPDHHKDKSTEEVVPVTQVKLIVESSYIRIFSSRCKCERCTGKVALTMTTLVNPVGNNDGKWEANVYCPNREFETAATVSEADLHPILSVHKEENEGGRNPAVVLAVTSIIVIQSLWLSLPVTALKTQKKMYPAVFPEGPMEIDLTAMDGSIIMELYTKNKQDYIQFLLDLATYTPGQAYTMAARKGAKAYSCPTPTDSIKQLYEKIIQEISQPPEDLKQAFTLARKNDMPTGESLNPTDVLQRKATAKKFRDTEARVQSDIDVYTAARLNNVLVFLGEPTRATLNQLHDELVLTDAEKDAALKVAENPKAAKDVIEKIHKYFAQVVVRASNMSMALAAFVSLGRE